MFHLKHVNKAQKGQRTFPKPAKEVSLVMSEASSSLSMKGIRTETIQTLKCVHSNLSFASANSDGDSFRTMFPESKITEKYSQNETNMKYVIQYGLSPYFQDLLKRDLKGKPFSLKFDENTTYQTKKQYNGYVRYWSERFDAVIMVYCDSLFVEKLAEHFYRFVQRAGLDINFMLHLGMDGPNVKKKFSIYYWNRHSLKKTTFLDVGTCPFHIVHNAFRKGVSSFWFNFDRFAFDIPFFFKLSAGF